MCLERQDFYFLLEEKEKLLESSLSEKEGGIIKNVWLANKHTCRDDDNDERMKRAMKEYIQMKRMSGQLFLVLNSRSSLSFSLFWRTLSFLLSLLIASNFPLLSFILLPPSLFAHDFAFGPSMGLGHWRIMWPQESREKLNEKAVEDSLLHLLWKLILQPLLLLLTLFIVKQNQSWIGIPNVIFLFRSWLSEKLSKGSRGRERGNETCKFPTYAADHRLEW